MTRAFTLLEVAVVTAVLGLLSVLLIPSLMNQVEAAQRTAEDHRLDELTQLLERSLRAESAAQNVSSFSGHSLDGTGLLDTRFDGTAELRSAVLESAWFTKLARLQGVNASAGGDFTAVAEPSLWALAYNALDQPRWLFVGPEEPGQQRYLLVSLLAPPVRGLVVPPPDGTAEWFDALWNHTWEGAAALLPPAWLDRLSADEINAWLDGSGESTRVSCLRVRRIVQPKQRLILNNTHPTYSAWVDFEGARSRLVSAPGSGVLTSDELLAGRLVVVRRGLTDPGVEACRFYLHEPTSITVQP